MIWRKALEGFLYMIMKKEKCWDLLHHYVYMHRGIPTFYDGTDAFVTRKENDHYVYHTVATVKQEKIHYIYPNAATVAIFKRVSDISTYKRNLARKKVVKEVCKPTDGSTSTHVWSICRAIITHPRLGYPPKE